MESTPEREEKVDTESRARVLAETVKHWNSFIRGLQAATVAWNKYREVRLTNKVHVEEFPLETQRHFVKANPHGDLDLIIEDIVTRPRLSDHLKTLFIPIK